MSKKTNIMIVAARKLNRKGLREADRISEQLAQVDASWSKKELLAAVNMNARRW